MTPLSLPTGSLTCNATTNQFNTLTCGQFGTTANDQQLAAQPNGIAGVKYWLTGNIVDNESAATTPTTTLTFTSSGTPTGNSVAAGILIPFSFDFTLAASNAGTLTSYSLVFDIKTGGTSIFAAPPTFAGPLTGSSKTVTGGNSFLTINPISNSLSYTVSSALTVNWSTGAGASGLTIGVPQNSLDVNGNTFSSVPEPASLGLLSLGLLAGGIFFRQRRKQS